MTYPTVAALNQLWDLFEKDVESLGGQAFPHLSEIKKLMTAESVIDLSLHEIYVHAKYVHQLTRHLLELKSESPNHPVIQTCAQHWLDILRSRNQTPLKLKHHQRLDGECDFRFTLQLMEGEKPCGFKDIQVLDRKNHADILAAIESMNRLDRVAGGMSFADLPVVKDVILSSLMEFEDVVCLIAKDQNNQIAGYCWGVMLRGVDVGLKQKANVFWVMDLARDPDFQDDKIKLGGALRAKMLETIKARGDCDFVGYQHVPNHKFHMDIIHRENGDVEEVRINDGKFDAKTGLKFDDDLALYMRTHFIRANDNNFPYPEREKIKPAILKAFWAAAHSAKDFVVGGITMFSRIRRQQRNNLLLDAPVEQRLTQEISEAQHDCDVAIFKKIILSQRWEQQGRGLLFDRHVPETMQAMQDLATNMFFNFQAIKSVAINAGKSATRGALAAQFYRAIAVADSPTFVLNSLLGSAETPAEWIALITNERQAVLNTRTEQEASPASLTLL